jgi:hypothetical protein
LLSFAVVSSELVAYLRQQVESLSPEQRFSQLEAWLASLKVLLVEDDGKRSDDAKVRILDPVGVAGRQLDVTQGDTGVEGGHDEAGSQHVRVNGPEPGPLADGPDPAVCGAPVEPLSVGTDEDGAVGALADGEIDGAGCAGHERDGGRPVALADDVQRSVPAAHAQVVDIGGAGL